MAEEGSSLGALQQAAIVMLVGIYLSVSRKSRAWRLQYCDELHD